MQIYWVEDDEMLLDLIASRNKDLNITLLNSWIKLPDLHIGDVVIHDWDGIGKKPKETEGVLYLCCSGTCDPSVKVDFPKPFDLNEIFKFIKDWDLHNQDNTYISF